MALTTLSERSSSIGPIGERSARTWFQRSSKASASSPGRTTSRARSPCRRALRRITAFPSGVCGPVERRAFAWFAAFCRSLVMVPAFTFADTARILGADTPP